MVAPIPSASVSVATAVKPGAGVRQGAHGVSHVLPGRVQSARAPRVAARFLGFLDAAEIAPHDAAGLVASDAPADELLDLLLEVIRELFVEIPIELPGACQGSPPERQYVQPTFEVHRGLRSI